MNHIPTTSEEALRRGWQELDIVFVTGDAYIDHPSFGVPLLARLLESRGFRVGIISQPDWKNPDSFRVLGRPRLFFAVSAGAMDSMVAHYTPRKKLRHDDAYTPGGRHGSRPNRAVIAYTAAVKGVFKDVPVLIGGIEASLRRFAHYDYWDDKVRRSILFDSKADILLYGMAEKSICEVASRVAAGEKVSQLNDIKGSAYISKEPLGADCCEIPSFEDVSVDKELFNQAFKKISEEQNPWSGKTLFQKHGNRFLVVMPPQFPLSENELDAVYDLPFTRTPHPSYKEPVPAFEQIKNSITTHRGCFGGCAFCAITHHQGKFIVSRSVESIVREVKSLSENRSFKGSLSDLGGPTANMYGLFCKEKVQAKKCQRGSCIYPQVCRNLSVDDTKAVTMLKEILKAKGIKNASISSGIRYDLLLLQPAYFRQLMSHHVGGLLKVAPEHLSEKVTKVMRKPVSKSFEKFLEKFRKAALEGGKRYAVVPYLISGHPGCTISDMADLAVKLKKLALKVEQAQEFTPTPGSLSTCIYWSGADPYSGEKIHVAKSDKEKILQKSLILSHLPEERKNILEALEQCGRKEIASVIFGNNGAVFSNTHKNKR